MVFTGGTLSMIGGDRVDLFAYRETGRRLSDDEVLARVPELARIAQVVPVPFATLESTSIGPSHWIALAHELERLFEADRVEGVVVTHGTNTLEETAYFLHLAVKAARPIVLTGSMRPSSALSADGDLNLFQAAAVAASPAAADRGVLVVLDDAIVSARDATKLETTRLHAFQGRDVGPLGFVATDGRIRFLHSPVRPHTHATEFSVAPGDELPVVHVLVSYATADGVAIDALVAAGARGIVLAGTGSGAATPLENEALDRAIAAGVVVCMASRVPGGFVPRTPEFARRAIVAAGDLPPWKARILLSLGLARTDVPAELQRMFDTY